MPLQPVAFSHAIHAGQLGMDCRYCHNAVEKSWYSNIPASSVCMNCHNQVLKDDPKLALVRDSYQTGKPIPWIQIHKLPDYVFFNHSVHVNRGVSLRRMPRPNQQDGRSLRKPSPSACPSAWIAIAIPPRTSGRWTKLPILTGNGAKTPRNQRGYATTGQRAKVRPRLEGRIFAELLRLSPMKTIPPPCPEPDTGPKYWRSLDQLADTPEFRQWAEREFPAGASEMSDPVTRRNFVKIMSASFLLAGLGGVSGCRRPVENIYPFSKMPEGYVHGVAKFYATAMPTRGTAIPLLAKSNDGRPTKLEGNAQHPDSNGGTDRYTQASILDLYDPDRATRFAKNGSTMTSARRRLGRPQPDSRKSARQWRPGLEFSGGAEQFAFARSACKKSWPKNCPRPALV